MKHLCIALAAALTMAAPAAWAQAGNISAAKERPTADTIAEQMAAYGQWLTRLTTAQGAALEELQTLQARWQAEMRASNVAAAAARFRPKMVSAQAAIDRSDAALKALDRPAFPALDLPDALTPNQLIAEMLKVNAQTRHLVSSFGPLLDAMVAHDTKAMERAGAQMLVAAKLLLDSQALLSSASLATIDREAAQYEAIQFDEMIYRTGSRLVAAVGVVMVGGKDRSLAGDLAKLADGMDAIAARGSAKLEHSIVENREVLAADKGGARASNQLIQKAVEIDELERGTFAAARKFAAELRAGAAKPLGMAELSALVVKMREARDAMDNVALAQNAVVARAD